ncbi:MAG: DUF4062 domain-containing protein [Methanobacteriaceae archaeon]|nr:DUF4062 domain-containing protein [Methanobacteriaceae archaeon]
MPRKETILRVFVASPNDVKDEREILEDVIREINKVWGKKLGTRFELVRWETDTFPDIGPDAQEAINEQIDDYDIFIGIMGASFGSPTNRAGSGTEEEFERAYQKYKENPNQIKIMFYFKNPSMNINTIDIDQLKKVRDFKDNLKDKGLYREYEDIQEFQNLVRMNLSRQMQYWEEKLEKNPEIVVEPKLEPFSEAEEEGILDLMEIGDKNVKELEAVMERISQSGITLGTELEETTATSTPTDRNQFMRASNKIANSMEQFANDIEEELPNFSESNYKTLDAFSRATILISEFQNDKSQYMGVIESINRAKTEYQRVGGMIADIRIKIESIPPISTKLNRAKRHTTAALDSFNNEITKAITMMMELEESLELK